MKDFKKKQWVTMSPSHRHHPVAFIICGTYTHTHTHKIKKKKLGALGTQLKMEKNIFSFPTEMHEEC